MTAEERDAFVRKYIEEQQKETDEELRAYLREVEANPVTFEELMADAEEALAQLEQTAISREGTRQ